MDNKITRRDFLKLTGAAAAGAAATAALGKLDMEKIAAVFERDPAATGVMKITVAGTEYWMPVYGDE